MSVVTPPPTETTYDIDARTLAEAARLVAGRNEAGHCGWSMTYEYEDTDRAGKPKGLTVTLTIEIELPRWVGRDSAPKAEQREWDRFLAALTRHEDGHREIAERGATRMHDRISQARARRADSIYHEEMRKTQNESDRYDTRTAHGERPPPGTIITVPSGTTSSGTPQPSRRR